MPTYPEPAGRPASMDLISRRAALEQMQAERLPDPRVTISDRAVGGVNTLDIQPPASAWTVLYLHGGGYRMGSPRALLPYLTRLAAASESRIVAVEYRLAPEHPFPAGLNDTIAAYRALRSEMGAPIIVAGDSAGGGLAAAVSLALADSGDAPPAALMLFSPWLDLRLTNSSWSECAHTDGLFSPESARDARQAYLGEDVEKLQHDTLASPALGDWTNGPPLLVQFSATEVLRDDSRALISTALAAGVRVEHEEFPDEPHVWHYAYPDTPGSRRAFAAIRAFLDGVPSTSKRPDIPPERLPTT